MLGWIITDVSLYHIAFCISGGTSQALVLVIGIHGCSEIGRETKSALICLILIQFAIVDPSLLFLSVQLTLINNPHRFRLCSNGAEVLDLFAIAWIKELILVWDDRTLPQRHFWCFKNQIFLLFLAVTEASDRFIDVSNCTLAIKDIWRSYRPTLLR